jgi:hypothetical protein
MIRVTIRPKFASNRCGTKWIIPKVNSASIESNCPVSATYRELARAG